MYWDGATEWAARGTAVHHHGTMLAPRRKARFAVSALFLLNGAAFANIVPRYPDIKDALDLSNGEFGIAVAAYPLGALIAGTLGGAAIRRWHSGRIGPVAVLLLSLNLVLIGAAPVWWLFAVGLCIAGALDSIADIANNAHGLRVERLYGTSILNSMHGLWSVGAVIGGVMGALAAGAGVPLVWHFSAAAVVFIVLALLVSRWMLPGADLAESVGADVPPATRGRLGYAPVLISLGLIAAAANMMEDVTSTWSAVYLRDSLGTGAVVAGFGFIALQAAQTVGRFAGDGLVTRFGDRAVARVGASLALVGMTLALVFATPVTTIVAFGMVGAGVGTLIPGAIRTAEGLPGLPPGTGLTWVSTTIRIGLFVSPPLVGFVADLTSLRVALAIMPILAVVILVASRTLGRRIG
ncbi:MFS transporter [Lacisediminihabitans sp. FW035]